VALPALTPETVSVAPVVVRFDNDTFTTAVFLDSAWIVPLAPLIFTAARPPAATVTLLGDSVSAAVASPANRTEQSINQTRSIRLIRVLALAVCDRFMMSFLPEKRDSMNGVHGRFHYGTVG
jgi:hypothetical protein